MKDLARYSGKAAEAAKARPSPAPVPATQQQSAPAVQHIRISDEEAGQRIDNFLLRICKGVPKSHVYRVLRSGQVRVNKGRIDQTYRLQKDDVVRIPPVRVAQVSNAYVPAAEFKILLEDGHLLVIDKPAGVAVHGGSGISFGVIEQLRASRPDAKFLELVHRLDRDTSGVLLLAKKRSALVNMHEQIRAGEIDKRYFALVHGNWKNEKQHVRLPLFKYLTANGERRVRVQEDGQVSHTIFTRLKNYAGYTLLEAELKTGRTHQIRVHLSASGFPIVGDDKYGDFEVNRALHKEQAEHTAFKRMFLHAHQITFVHPFSGKPVTLRADLPPDCVRFLDSLIRA
ncbi:MAG: RluA family pseudouridine synthase [Herbaspirillum sp.]